jgi:hypothetical protein
MCDPPQALSRASPDDWETVSVSEASKNLRHYSFVFNSLACSLMNSRI